MASTKKPHRSNSKSTRLSISKDQAIADYRLAVLSRHASVIGRREVMTGKAKFGIFGDGKEVAQIAMARAFQKGDWRSGYYRDQTFMFALEALTVQQWFAQLYADADADTDREPASGGRQMNSHFATRYIDSEGAWLNQTELYNSSADLSPTAGQMPRLVGLAYASKLYRAQAGIQPSQVFSKDGNEVAFGTIGNASAAEGHFWEAINAATVLQIPVAMSVWDDGFGISVPNKLQIAKESISRCLSGMKPKDNEPGLAIHVVPGWDYPTLLRVYNEGVAAVRQLQQPALFHVIDLTQPQGHSTSGSHERYKSSERMQFEQEFDCLTKMHQWIISEQLASEEELNEVAQDAKQDVASAQKEAWEAYLTPLRKDQYDLLKLYEELASNEEKFAEPLNEERRRLLELPTLLRRNFAASARRMAIELRGTKAASTLRRYVDSYQQQNQQRYSKWSLCDDQGSALKAAEIAPVYSDNPVRIPGSEIINRYFDILLGRDARVFILGEDVGFLGGVNQAFKGLQDKYGELRVTDTGIRETTILGQGLGAAMRGLRPIVDIQYLDYVLYCLQTLSDDLASLHYRSAGGQLAPVIIRTKGHRLEGIWHTGSPMGTLVSSLRGIHLCVPRNMVQAAGLYNTLLQGDEPGLLVEVLNGYRLKEAVPTNLDTITIPLGQVEVVRSGTDLTLVTYGACVKLAEDAATYLADLGLSIEVIDIQTLLPFDRHRAIRKSLEKTNTLMVVDEDVPGGASAYILKNILEDQEGYDLLDGAPKTLAAQAHRGAYGSDGDYWCKPNTEDIIETAYQLARDRDPTKYPSI